MTNQEVIIAFVDAINAGAIDALLESMSDDHTFIDARGNEVTGRETMRGLTRLLRMVSGL